jgi:hypothetical protein
VIALLRYSWIDTLRSQRWVAPILCFGAVEAIVCAQAGSVLPTYAVLAAVLLFIATWLSIVTINNEDPIQQSITGVCAGGQGKVRLAKVSAAFLVAAILGVAGTTGPPLATSNGSSATDALAGLSAQLLAALAGVALGALCSRPLITRRAWSVLIGAGVCLVTVIVPYAPPTRQLLVLFNKTGSYKIGLPLVLIGVETIIIAIVAVSASLRIARRIT